MNTPTPHKDTILIVDDLPINVSVLFKHLNKSGFDVLVARDGAEAIERVEYAHPDLILLDVMMPGMDGFEVCQRLKAQPTTQDIPIIFMTALTDGIDKVKGLTLGAVDYVTKPFQTEEVLARINAHLNVYKLQRQLAQQNRALEENNILLQQEIQRREQVEQELRHAKEAAEAANRAKSTFLANMSHELRTPLNGILGYAQILGMDKTLNPKHKKGVDIIQRSGEYLLTLINDVLDLSKIEAERIELYPIDFNLEHFLRGLTDLFQMRAKQKGIAFVYEQLSHLPEGVRADDKRLRQILINLLGNAVKFTETGGVTFKVGYHQHRLRFQIEDTGIGIAPEDLDKIYLPFQQVGDQNYRAEGTGLGLSITKKLVNLMGGELGVESHFGKGSIFWIELELPEVTGLVKQVDVKMPVITGHQEPRRKILIVDDKWENRAVLVSLLTPLGFETIEAENGKMGLHQTIECHPDLILTDLVMPVMDGFEATRQLRKMLEFKELPIVAVSASTFNLDHQESLDAGCNEFLVKPIRAELVLATLQKFLGLTWIYEPTTSGQTVAVEENPEELVNLTTLKMSAKQAAIFLELATMGDFMGIQDEAERLAETDKQLAPLASKLIQLAEDFEEDKIGELVRQSMDSH
jgi:signal transduction histidine kinase